jgi:hypothetical protein
MTNIEKMILITIGILIFLTIGSIFLCNKAVKEVGGIKGVTNQLWNGVDSNAKKDH